MFTSPVPRRHPRPRRRRTRVRIHALAVPRAIRARRARGDRHGEPDADIHQSAARDDPGRRAGVREGAEDRFSRGGACL